MLQTYNHLTVLDMTETTAIVRAQTSKFGSEFNQWLGARGLPPPGVNIFVEFEATIQIHSIVAAPR